MWFFTRTRMSRWISVSPIGAACAYSGLDVALPEVGRLHHVQVAVADHVVTKAHRAT